MRQQKCVEIVGVCGLVGTLVAAMTPIKVMGQSGQLPTPWVAADIGAPLPAGTSMYDTQAFTISAGGVDIWDTEDQFHFVYQQVSDDLDIVARVDSLSPTDQWSKVGVMIRGDLSAGAANAFAAVTGANGVDFQSRPHAGASSQWTPGGAVTAPQWVRLTRTGTTVVGYSSPDGGTWQQVDSATVALGQSVYVGLAITSVTPGSAASAVLSQVTVKPISSSLPTGQQAADIGTPAITGSTSYSAGVYTISAGGVDIWHTSDQFRFVYQPVNGDVDIVARVNSLVNADTWSKAGVMVRESLDPDARHAMATMSAEQGYSFQWRLDIGGLADSVPGGAGTAPAWVRLVRTGSQFQAFRSTDGSNWTSMGTEVVPMGQAVYAGVAVTSHNASLTTTAVVDQLTITQPNAPPNQPPTVSLTAPAPASQYTAPANIVVSATASDPENRLARVDFFANSTKIGSLTAAPFTITWSAVPSGTYSLTASAFDANGGSATSSAVTINVMPAGTALPRFAVFQASADHATLVTSYRLDLFSNGADPNTETPLVSSDLGKPTPDASGTITVDQTSLFAALQTGTYEATVSAIGTAGESRSAAVNFVR